MNKGKEKKIKMRKTKSQKAITLVALIITIVVLLILAAVAITAITEYNIIDNANSAAQKYGEQAGQEDSTLKDYNSVLDQYMTGSTGGNGSEDGSGSASEEETGNWTQTGTTITDGTTTLAVGDSVKLQVGNGTVEEYSANGYSNWKVLGVENGKLLLVTVENVGDLYLEGKEGYNTGIAQLNDRCDDYLNTTYADEARSIKVEDINRITGFDPESYSGYGTQYTYTSNFEHPTKGTASEANPITETFTYYDYLTSSSEIGESAYNLLFGDYYWLASSYAHALSGGASFGLRCVSDSSVGTMYLWDSDDCYECGNEGFRVVVSLKSDVKVTRI